MISKEKIVEVVKRFAAQHHSQKFFFSDPRQGVHMRIVIWIFLVIRNAKFSSSHRSKEIRKYLIGMKIAMDILVLIRGSEFRNAASLFADSSGVK